MKLFDQLDSLDLALFRKTIGARSNLLDKILFSLSRAANHSVLWLCISLLLAGAGGRFGRRAALRGLVSILITSLVTNLPLKFLARRRRPDLRAFPHIPNLRRLPRSSSFPSGHSASAAAFTTGVALEFPEAAVPIGLVASAVGYSRVYSGVHYPADVLAGAAVGVGVGMLTTRFWPVAPHDPAMARPAYQAVQNRPSPDGSGVVIVYNPTSGPALTTHPIEKVRKALPQARIIQLTKDEPFLETMKQASRGALILGVAGGDGTVNLGASVARSENLPLLVFPTGTLNHFARDLGLFSVEDSVDAIKHGHTVAVDVGSIDGKPFLNTASIGNYVEMVDAREKLETKIGKWPAVVVALFRVLRSSRPIRVEIDGVSRVVWMIFFGNCKYQPSGFAPSWRERLDDGLVDIRIVDASQPWSRSRLVLSVLTGSLGRSRVYEEFTDTDVTIHSLQGRVRLARDGETFKGSEQFEVTKSERPIAVYVPKQSLAEVLSEEEDRPRQAVAGGLRQGG
jgi:diacylglycerol kinase family enzyme/membrane-associated phospholipid phosphatase